MKKGEVVGEEGGGVCSTLFLSLFFAVTVKFQDAQDKTGLMEIKKRANSSRIMPSKMEVASQYWTDWTDSTVEKIEINRKI